MTKKMIANTLVLLFMGLFAVGLTFIAQYSMLGGIVAIMVFSYAMFMSGVVTGMMTSGVMSIFEDNN